MSRKNKKKIKESRHELARERDKARQELKEIKLVLDDLLRERFNVTLVELFTLVESANTFVFDPKNINDIIRNTPYVGVNREAFTHLQWATKRCLAALRDRGIYSHKETFTEILINSHKADTEGWNLEVADPADPVDV